MTLHRNVSRLFALLAVSAVGATVCAAPATASSHDDGHHGHRGDTFTVIGDLPYGDTDFAKLPGWVDDINASDTDFTVHLGDIKSGSQRCDTSYFTKIRTEFDRFAAPFVYTPGDNEWTDCHRVNNGAYQPLERLDVLRSIFFDRPGRTLGTKPMKVDAQTKRGLPENVSFRRDGVDFTAIHVIGSNDDLQPWSGIGNTTTTPAQVAEEKNRMAGVVAAVREATATAIRKHDRAVAIFLQADMFDPTYTPTPTDISAFKPLVQALVDADRAFRGEIYVFNGDSHIANSDHPLAAGSVWLERYGVKGSAPGLTRVTVDGSDNASKDYLQVTVNRRGPALTWQRVPYSG